MPPSHEARKEIRRSRAAVRLLREALGPSPVPAGKRTSARRRAGAQRCPRRPRAGADAGACCGRSHPRLLRGPGSRGALRPAAGPAEKSASDVRCALGSTGRGSAPHPGTDAVQCRPVARLVTVGGRRWARHSEDFTQRAGTKRVNQRRRPDDGRLHEWRKQVKNLRHALQVFEPLHLQAVEAGEACASPGRQPG